MTPFVAAVYILHIHLFVPGLTPVSIPCHLADTFLALAFLSWLAFEVWVADATQVDTQQQTMTTTVFAAAAGALKKSQLKTKD